jgi:hypothetical protein
MLKFAIYFYKTYIQDTYINNMTKRLLILTTSIVTFLSVNAQIATPKACYGFDGNIQDEANAFHASAASPVFAASKNGGNDSAISFTNSSVLKLPIDVQNLQPQTLSISLWVKAVDVTNNQYLLFQKNTSNADFEGLVLVVGEGVIKLIKNNPTTSNFSVCKSKFINANEWNHITAVFTGDSLKLYRNGVLEGSAVSNFPIDYNATTGFVLGGSAETFNLPFTGLVDNLQLYNKILTKHEIGLIALNNLSCKGKIDKAEDYFYISCKGRIKDASVNKYTTTDTNITYGNDIANSPNSALVLNGTGYITMPTGFIPSTARMFSVSLWFKTSETGKPNGIAWAGSATVGGYPSNYTPLMWLDSNGYLCGFIYDGTITSPKSTTKLNDDKWHHVAYQIFVNQGNGALTQSIWVDGKMDNEKASFVTNGQYLFTNFYIGTCNARGINNNMPDYWFHFKGQLDEIRTGNIYYPADMLKNYDLVITKHPQNITFTNGQTITLEVDHTDYNNGVAYSYQWYKDGVAILGATSKIYTKTATSTDNGIYHCLVTNNTDMPLIVSSNAAAVAFNSGVSISETSVSTIGVYPNPTNDILYTSAPSLLTLYNISGQQVLKAEVNERGVSINHLGKGVYIAKIYSKQKETIQKVVIN